MVTTNQGTRFHKQNLNKNIWFFWTFTSILIGIIHIWWKSIHLQYICVRYSLIFLSEGIHNLYTWWRHQMETFSALLAICAGNSPVPGEFPTQRPVTRSFDVFCDLRLNKRLSKQWWGCWFETPSRPLWRNRNVYWTVVMVLCIPFEQLNVSIGVCLQHIYFKFKRCEKNTDFRISMSPSLIILWCIFQAY